MATTRTSRSRSEDLVRALGWEPLEVSVAEQALHVEHNPAVGAHGAGRRTLPPIVWAMLTRWTSDRPHVTVLIPRVAAESRTVEVFVEAERVDLAEAKAEVEALATAVAVAVALVWRNRRSGAPTRERRRYRRRS